MSLVTIQEVRELIDEQQSPCISIYQPLHKAYPDRQRDRIEFRNYVDCVEETMRSALPAQTVNPLIEKLRAITADQSFWRQGRDGIAVLASPAGVHTFEMRSPVSALAVVSDSYHIKPLLRMVQSADRFHVLCLQRDQVRLFEGNRDELVEVHPDGIPLTPATAVGEDVIAQRGKPAEMSGKGGESRPAPRGRDAPAGHPSKGDDAKLDAQRFFHAVDLAVTERLSQPSELPLLVVALPEDWAMFRDLSHNPKLLDFAIERSPDMISEHDLRLEAWKRIEPLYVAKLDALIENYRVAAEQGLASNDLQDVRRSTDQGRVRALLIQADEDRSPEDSLESELAGQSSSINPLADDPLDDLAEHVMRQGGSVVVVPRERMPSVTGLAAIYRF